MSSKRISLSEINDQFNFFTDEFFELIDAQYIKRCVTKLTGVNDGDIYQTPISKRNDSDLNGDARLIQVLGYLMGSLDWDISELAVSRLLGIYDHKGWLTSFWDGQPPMNELAALHNAWNAQMEPLHHAVMFYGKDNPETIAFEINYETTD